MSTIKWEYNSSCQSSLGSVGTWPYYVMRSMGTFEDLTLFDLEMLLPALFLTLFFEAWSMVGAIFLTTLVQTSPPTAKKSRYRSGSPFASALILLLARKYSSEPLWATNSNLCHVKWISVLFVWVCSFVVTCRLVKLYTYIRFILQLYDSWYLDEVLRLRY